MEFDPLSPTTVGLALIGYVFVTCALHTLLTRAKLDLARHDLVRESRLLRKAHMEKLAAEASAQAAKSARAVTSLTEHRALHAAPAPKPAARGHGHGPHRGR